MKIDFCILKYLQILWGIDEERGLSGQDMCVAASLDISIICNVWHGAAKQSRSRVSEPEETNVRVGAGRAAEAGAFVILFVVRLCFQEFVLLTTFDTLISPSPLSALYLMSKLSPLAAHNMFCLSFS